jgi:F-type H+-transporting ATPase subunit delta
MAAREEHNREVAKIYAASLLALATEAGSADDVLGELEELARYAREHAAFQEFLASPLVETAARAAVLEKVLRGRASDLVVDGVEVLNRRGRAGLLPEVAAAYRDWLRLERGEVDATVVSAVPLSPVLREQLRAALARRTGMKPALIERTDPALLGGLVVEVLGQKIDTSLATQLRSFATALVERATRELGDATASN